MIDITITGPDIVFSILAYGVMRTAWTYVKVGLKK